MPDQHNTDSALPHRTLLLSEADVRALLPMHECIEVMDEALRSLSRGDSAMPLRTVMRTRQTASGTNAFACMPAMVGRDAGASIGAKVISVVPGNLTTAYDSHIGVVLLFDAEFGRLVAIADASSITAIRTAAVSGLATRTLARADASTVALLGTGVLAMPHLEAMRCVRPVMRVQVWSRTPARADAFVQRARERTGLDVVLAGSARDAVRGADVICTITSAGTPVLEGAWLEAGVHVNAVGASVPSARELDGAAVAAARLFADRRESTLAEAGDFLMARSEGLVTDAHVLGDLGDVLLGTIAGRQGAGDITLFKSLGLAVEDVAAARHLVERARLAGRGTWMDFGGHRNSEQH
ncbi:MAG TPA: ornithine cyclodeaminase family protein [Gemmatimonas sp.]|nr:ornithine cyclodeaminase family protein [Gemmatimonas sp.]